MQCTFPILYSLLFCLEWEAAKLFLCLVFDDHPFLDLVLKGALLPVGSDSCAESQPSSLLTPLSYPDPCSVCTGRFLCSCPRCGPGGLGTLWLPCAGSPCAESNVLPWFSPLLGWSTFSSSFLRNVCVRKVFWELMHANISSPTLTFDWQLGWKFLSLGLRSCRPLPQAHKVAVRSQSGLTSFLHMRPLSSLK